MIALNHFANNASPDGYTLLATASSMFTIAPIFTPELVSHNGVNLITTLSAGPVVLISSKDSKYKTFDDFRKDVQQNATPVIAVPSLFFRASAEYIANKISKDTRITTAMYKGGPEAVKDVMGGHAQLAVVQLSVVAPLIETNKFNVLAISGDRRLEALPNVPTFTEKVKGINPKIEASWGIALPNGASSEVQKFYSNFFTQVARQEETRKLFVQYFMIIPKAYIGREAFDRRLAEETEMWNSVLHRVKP